MGDRVVRGGRERERERERGIQDWGKMYQSGGVTTNTPAIKGRRMGCKPAVLETVDAPLGLCLLRQQRYVWGFPARYIRTPLSPCVGCATSSCVRQTTASIDRRGQGERASLGTCRGVVSEHHAGSSSRIVITRKWRVEGAEDTVEASYSIDVAK